MVKMKMYREGAAAIGLLLGWVIFGVLVGTANAYPNVTFGSQRVIYRTKRGILSIAVDPTGTQILIGGGDLGSPFQSGEAHLVAIDSGTATSIKGPVGLVKSATWTADGKKFLLGCDKVRIYATANQKEISTLSMKWRLTQSIALSKDGVRMAAGSSLSADHQDKISIWDSASLKHVCSCVGHQAEPVSKASSVLGMVFSIDGSLLYSVGTDEYVRVWNTKTGSASGAWHWDDGIITAIALSPDGKRVLTANLAGSIRLWQVDGKVLKTIPAIEEDAGISSVQISRDGALLGIGCGSGKVKILELERLINLAEVNLERASIMGVAFSPNGDSIAAASARLKGRDEDEVVVWKLRR